MSTVYLILPTFYFIIMTFDLISTFNPKVKDFFLPEKYYILSQFPLFTSQFGLFRLIILTFYFTPISDCGYLVSSDGNRLLCLYFCQFCLHSQGTLYLMTPSRHFKNRTKGGYFTLKVVFARSQNNL